jgi:hypothetical protein
MLHESPSALNRVVTSLKIAAVVTVLGTVVLAAERELATKISPEEIVAADIAPAHLPPAAKPATAEQAPAEQAPADYFPSHFPAPKGEPAEPMPTF